MRKLPLFLVTFIVLTATSCTPKYTVKGSASLNMLSGKTIYLKALTEESNLVTVDSAQIIHGEFNMEGITKSTPQMVTLFMDDLPMTPIILEPGVINISISPTELIIGGTPLNNALYSFYQQNQQLEYKIQNTINAQSASNIYYSMIDEHQALIRDFVEYNHNNVLGATVFSIYHNQYPELLDTSQVDIYANHAAETQEELYQIYSAFINTPFRETFPSGFFLW